MPPFDTGIHVETDSMGLATPVPTGWGRPADPLTRISLQRLSPDTHRLMRWLITSQRNFQYIPGLACLFRGVFRAQ